MVTFGTFKHKKKLSSLDNPLKSATELSAAEAEAKKLMVIAEEIEVQSTDFEARQIVKGQMLNLLNKGNIFAHFKSACEFSIIFEQLVQTAILQNR